MLKAGANLLKVHRDNNVPTYTYLTPLKMGGTNMTKNYLLPSILSAIILWIYRLEGTLLIHRLWQVCTISSGFHLLGIKNKDKNLLNG